MLSTEDPLPHRPRRVVVAGASGSGKTTLARRIGIALKLPVTEMDALHHGPAWTPRQEFMADVETFSSADAWVSEWQYPEARKLLADRADTMVWLDVATPVTMMRVVRRTVTRRLRDEELWNGNKEAPLHTVFTDPEHILRWAWRTRHLLRELVPPLEGTHPHLAVVRLRRRSDADRFIACLDAGVA
ncbi:AAA family ATPase [Aeromicrobium sp.]|uniref:AAA family ATPase n=1 Tax=Aeromicrobium sp. TaxID=1871063 RepID=UPI003D6AD0B1